MADRQSTKTYPLISVLVLTYKDIEALWITLHSILEQDYPRIELIISNDGINEWNSNWLKIESFVNEYKQDNLQSFIVNQLPKNVGIVKHGNILINMAHGDYIKFLPPGDYFADPKVLSTYYREITQSNALIIAAQQAICDPKTKQFFSITPKNRALKVFNNMSALQQHRYMVLYCANIFGAISMFFSADLFRKYGLFDERYKYIEDYPYWLHVTRCSVKINFIPQITTLYDNSSGISNALDHPLAAQFSTERKAIYETSISNCQIPPLSKRLIFFLMNRRESYRQRWIKSMPFLKKRLLQLRYLDVILWRICQKAVIIWFSLKK